MADLIESLGNPSVLLVTDITARAESGSLYQFAEFLKDGKQRRKVSMELESNGYLRLNNPHDDRGRWRLPGGDHVTVQRVAVGLVDVVPEIDGLSGERSDAVATNSNQDSISPRTRESSGEVGKNSFSPPNKAGSQ